MKKLLLLAVATLGFGVFAAPKAAAGVYIGIGLPVVPFYPAYYPAYCAPYPYYRYLYAYGYYGHPGYGRVYNGRVVGHSTHPSRANISDK
jgi:hypothetical protein